MINKGILLLLFAGLIVYAAGVYLVGFVVMTLASVFAVVVTALVVAGVNIMCRS